MVTETTGARSGDATFRSTAATASSHRSAASGPHSTEIDGSSDGKALIGGTAGDAFVSLAVGVVMLGVGAELHAASSIAATLEAMARRVI